eukprot:2386717-Alexandrium_andersonii.AAC.1
MLTSELNNSGFPEKEVSAIAQNIFDRVSTSAAAASATTRTAAPLQLLLEPWSYMTEEDLK